MKRHWSVSSPSFCLVAAVALIVPAALGCEDNPHPPGGCELETIAVGGSFRSEGPVPVDALRIELCAVPYPGTALYRQAADELAAALDSAGVEAYSRSEVTHIASGPCWPPYTLTFTSEPYSGRIDSLRARLLATPIAGFSPHAEKDSIDAYGKFFVTCVKWDSDLWTVWYR